MAQRRRRHLQRGRVRDRADRICRNDIVHPSSPRPAESSHYRRLHRGYCPNRSDPAGGQKRLSITFKRSFVEGGTDRNHSNEAEVQAVSACRIGRSCGRRRRRAAGFAAFRLLFLSELLAFSLLHVLLVLPIPDNRDMRAGNIGSEEALQRLHVPVVLAGLTAHVVVAVSWNLGHGWGVGIAPALDDLPGVLAVEAVVRVVVLVGLAEGHRQQGQGVGTAVRHMIARRMIDAVAGIGQRFKTLRGNIGAALDAGSIRAVLHRGKRGFDPDQLHVLLVLEHEILLALEHFRADISRMVVDRGQLARLVPEGIEQAVMLGFLAQQFQLLFFLDQPPAHAGKKRVGMRHRLTHTFHRYIDTSVVDYRLD
ncbi:hypothetical protein BN871_GH_00090 [Paenibacillus sp. P22]|nr:hypothetical protein BN871_GH_00090 [Paenibacillus sp. P22]